MKVRCANGLGQLGIEDCVIFAGYVPDPWEFYREAKVVIVTSKFEPLAWF
jgi:glycosyltransferase involved in cell wall biosynthesis